MSTDSIKKRFIFAEHKFLLKNNINFCFTGSERSSC